MFKIAYTLPISRQTIRYGEFTNKVWGTLIKYITNDDDTSIELFFDEIIENLTNANPKHLINVDKFCLLLDIRSTFLGHQLELRTKLDYPVKISINTIIESLSNKIHKIQHTKLITTNNVVITLSAPRKLSISDFDELVEHSIYKITDNGDEHFVDDFTTAERELFFSSLPANIITEINNFVLNLQKMTQTVEILQENVNLGIERVNFNFYDKTMISFLKSIFADDLMNFYEMQYNLIVKLGLTYDHFLQMTPSESRIFINLHNRDAKRQEEAFNKGSQPTSIHPQGISGI